MPPDNSPTRDHRLLDLLAEWEDCRDAGSPQSAEEICRNCPELAAPLAEQIDRLNRVDALLETLDQGFEEGASIDTSPEADRSDSTRPDDVVTTHANYQIGSFHAAGGRARIYVARDEVLGRDVAVKLLRPLVASESTSRMRLLREAAITGRLEHPGVLPVYGMGIASGGDPFYCMRLVDGQSLRQAITAFHAMDHVGPIGERRFDFARLLRHFVDACQTIAYAHAQGVIHRDLKPENILIGEYGETFVVDWGLAKRIDEPPESDAAPEARPAVAADPTGDPHATRIGQALGTPAYMSPEQARGDVTRMDATSDLFNLGATLYTVLTGIAPYGGDHVGDVLDRAERCDFLHPRERRVDVPRPLEAICLKAMSAGPGGRYTSATRLADDVNRWLAGEPISCHRESLGVRAGRWMRRHRTLATSLAVLLATAIVALAASTVLVGRQRARADANFVRARQAVDELFTKISQNQLLHVPGMQPLRSDLLAETVKYYRDFRDEQQRDPALARELAETALRLGEIYAQSGDTDQAIALLAEAAEIAAARRQSAPQDHQNLRTHVRARRLLAQATFHAGEVDAAIRIGHQAIEDLSTDLAAWPLAKELLTENAEAWLLLATIHRLRDDLEASDAALHRAREAAERLQANAPGTADDLLLVRLLMLQADGHGRDDAAELAVPTYAEAYERLLAIREDPRYALNAEQLLRTVCTSLGEMHLQDADLDQARHWFELSFGSAQRLVEKYPSVDDFRQRLSDSAHNAVLVFVQLEQYHRALEYARHDAAARRHLGQPTDEVRQAMAIFHWELAERNHGQGRMDEALHNYRMARRIYDELDLRLERSQLGPLVGNMLFVGYHQLESGNADRAAATFLEAIEFFEPYVSEPLAERIPDRLSTAALWLGLAMARFQRGELEPSHVANQRAIDQLEWVVRHDGGSEHARMGLCGAYFQLEGVLKRLDKPDEAKAAARHSSEFRPTSPTALYELARQYASYGRLVGRGRDPLDDAELEELERYLDRAVVCLQEALERGYDDRESVRHDPAFIPLRWHPAFKSLFAAGESPTTSAAHD